jgi:hypothetical protein
MITERSFVFNGWRISTSHASFIRVYNRSLFIGICFRCGVFENDLIESFWLD